MLEAILEPAQRELRNEVRAFVRWVPRQLILDMDADRVRYPRDFVEEAARRNSEAQEAQQTLGDQVRELAEQLHQQHQQHDRLQQQVRERKARQDALRAEFEREAAALRAEVERLQAELERQRSPAAAGEQAPAAAAPTPPPVATR